jgi:hypothetical protein
VPTGPASTSRRTLGPSVLWTRSSDGTLPTEQSSATGLTIRPSWELSPAGTNTVVLAGRATCVPEGADTSGIQRTATVTLRRLSGWTPGSDLGRARRPKLHGMQEVSGQTASTRQGAVGLEWRSSRPSSHPTYGANSSCSFILNGKPSSLGPDIHTYGHSHDVRSLYYGGAQDPACVAGWQKAGLTLLASVAGKAL